MSHALTHPDVTQPVPVPPVEPPPPLADPAPSARPIAELIAAELSGLRVAYGDLVQMVSTVTGDGDAVVVDLTRIAVAGSSVTARVVLTLTRPLPVAPPVEPLGRDQPAGHDACEPTGSAT